jgi:hypothetical protein
MQISDERLAVMLEAIRPPVGAVVLKGDDLEAVRSVLAELIVLRPPLRTIQSAVPKYLKKEMTAEEFALVCVGEVDNKAVFRALGSEKR